MSEINHNASSLTESLGYTQEQGDALITKFNSLFETDSIKEKGFKPSEFVELLEKTFSFRELSFLFWGVYAERVEVLEKFDILQSAILSTSSK